MASGTAKKVEPAKRPAIYPLGQRPFRRNHHRSSMRGIAQVRAQEKSST